MKVTFEFEHPFQLVDLLEVLTKSALERQEPARMEEPESMCSMAGTVYEK
jgi:hypothetical protein